MGKCGGVNLQRGATHWGRPGRTEKLAVCSPEKKELGEMWQLTSSPYRNTSKGKGVITLSVVEKKRTIGPSAVPGQRGEDQ